ncbi:MAG: hypothetical protein D6705_01205 [Deltaproteobacteria bacterium]|nr:MAG: hypothetical protein D6705_01205 [Deltaproteobacteria bacterium]
MFHRAPAVFRCVPHARRRGCREAIPLVAVLLSVVPVPARGAVGPTDAPATPPSADVPATPPGTDAPATPPSTDAPAAPPSTDAPAAPPSGKAEDQPAGTAEAPGAGEGGAADGDVPTEGGVPSASGPSAATTTETRAPRAVHPRSHHRLGLLGVAAGWGYFGIVPYNDGQFCGQYSTDPGSDTGRKAFCTERRGMAFLDLTGGYGVHPRIDLLLTVRINLMKRDYVCKDAGDPETCSGLFVDKVGFGLFPGIRAYFSKPEALVKVGAAVDFLWMHENFAGYRGRPVCTGTSGTEVVCPLGREAPKDDAERKTKDDDIGLRLGFLVQADVHHNVGVFLMPAARMTFLRWFEFGLDIQAGIQTRFP